MKRLIGIMLAVALLVSVMAVTVSAAGASISVNDVSAKNGETVEINVSISGNTGFASGKVTLSYDKEALELTALEGVLFKGNLNVNNGIANHYQGVVTEDGVLVKATFKVLATSGDYTVSAAISGMRDADGTLIEISDASGTVSVTCDHAWGEWKETTAATCTEAGEQARTCSKCQETETETVAATGHAWGVWAVVNPATCTEAGLEGRACANDANHIETRELAATGHAWGEWLETIPATCTETGVNTRLCANDETHQESQVVPATGHTKGEAVKENEVAPTCTEAGSYDEVVYCTVCKEELSRETKTVAATGHTAGEAVKENEVAATCTEAGSYDEVVSCTVCKEELSRETKTVEALGHEWEYTKDEEGHEATCTACEAVMEKTAHAYENNGYCECGHKDPNYVEEDPGLDDVPSTGDITPMIVTAVFAMVAMVAAAAYMLKRKFAV